MTAFAVVASLGTVGIAEGSASAYLTNCSGAINNGANTQSYCQGQVGQPGQQRSRHFCNTTTGGSFQNGPWKGKISVSQTANCGSTVSGRTQQIA